MNNAKYEELLRRELSIKTAILVALGLTPMCISLFGWLMDQILSWGRIVTFGVGAIVFLLLLPNILKLAWELRKC